MIADKRIAVELNLPARVVEDAQNLILATADNAAKHGVEMRDLDITTYPVGRYKGRAWRAMEWCFSVEARRETAAQKWVSETIKILADEYGAM
jgi:hypothetical protein